LLLCSFDGLLPGVALIDIGKGYSLARRLLDCFGEAADLGAVIDIGGGDMERQQMAERIDRQMQLGAALALGTVIAGARAAFRSRAQGPAVKDRGYRLCLAARCHAHYGAKVSRVAFLVRQRDGAAASLAQGKRISIWC
jgi:hypothetical protein